MNFPNNETLMAHLQQATRLTNAGQLQQATALIQRALQGKPVAQTAARSADFTDGALFEGQCYEVDKEEIESNHGPSKRAKKSATNREHAADEAVTPPWSGAFAGESASELTKVGLGGVSKQWRDTLSGLKVKQPSPALPEGATFNNATFANAAGSRDYKLYVPSSYQGQALPLVVMLHGCTQNPDDFAAGTGMNLLAEKTPCLVLYPAQRGSANHSRCWNWFKPSDQRRDAGEPAIIADMTRQIIKEYRLDKQRVYVAGLSAGGAMATTLAQLYPELYAAVGVHSGLPYGVAQDMPSALAAMQGSASPLAGLNQSRSRAVNGEKIPAIIFHGDQDSTVHPSNGERVAAQYLAGAALSPSKTQPQQRTGKVAKGRSYTCTVHSHSNGKSLLELWSIHGGAHAWAGGDSAGSYTDPKGPNASREMLRFFLAHPKNAS
ncbi:extracellular catalytic domain type 1 short-chain-length polyhydroxyalkanoate depolymerase [Oceanisphaera avium]|uniref:Esterase n=1 Tax=Oceanisphaera avium TaxID=1903694 RepID=A0A1Y0CZA8_9GAMM|nr:PHB depolymerase family esterase [Oceanisphaera avium]ART80651.1 hypothetical protein CBP12_11260 [Oceanisphaera avium]